MPAPRPAAWGALALALAVSTSAALAAPSSASSLTRGAGTTTVAKAAPTTGRLITTTKRGVVLVNEDGDDRRAIIDAKKTHARIVSMYPTTGVFLWGTGRGHRTRWHIGNLYGGELGSFRLKRGTSTPAIDSGGYDAYWVKQGDATRSATLVRKDINDPLGKPVAIRDLGPGEVENLTLSPDYQWAAMILVNGATRRVVLASTDGAIARTVPMPAGATALTGPVFAPDSGRVAFTTSPAGTIYLAPVAGDYAPIALPQVAPRLFDWSPDGLTLLTGSTDDPNLAAVDAATGVVRDYFFAEHVPGATGVFWSGLKPNELPRDRVDPALEVVTPGAATVRAWRTIGGRATDRGGSLVRYVVIAAFQKRGGSWWALVGDGKHPTWRKVASRDEATYTAKERRTEIVGNRWSQQIPGLTAGELVVVAKVSDGAGNGVTRTVSAVLR